MSKKSASHLWVIWVKGFVAHPGHSTTDHEAYPANAELVPFLENLRRYREQREGLVTLDDLIHRIELWDGGDRNLPKFYDEMVRMENSAISTSTL